MEELTEIREKAKKDGNPVLRDKSFELLKETVRKLNPKSILEVGMNVGVSAIAMMREAPLATYTGIEINEDAIKCARENFEKFSLSNRTNILVGDADEIISMLSAKYDFIFLDGPKGHYYDEALNLIPLLNKGGILFADNVLFKGYVLGEIKTPHRQMTIKNSMKRFLEYVSKTKGLKTTLYHVEDGVSITEKYE